MKCPARVAPARAILAPPTRAIIAGVVMGAMMVNSPRHESRRVLVPSQVTCEEARPSTTAAPT